MPKQFFLSLIPKLETRWAILKHHLFPAAGIVSIIMGVYYLQSSTVAGWMTYAISSVFLALLGITALARLNGISYENYTFNWQVRRGGLIGVGVACLWLILAPLRQHFNGNLVDFPSWYEVMLRAGVFFVWMTTPMMPPWWRYISGEYRRVTIEAPAGAHVEIHRVDTDHNGAIFVERRNPDKPDEYGP